MQYEIGYARVSREDQNPQYQRDVKRSPPSRKPLSEYRGR